MNNKTIERVPANWGSKAIRLGKREHYRATGKQLPVDFRAGQEDKIRYMETYLSKDKRYIPYEKREAYADQMRQKVKKQQEKEQDLKPILIIICAVIAIGYLLYAGGAFNLP